MIWNNLPTLEFSLNYPQRFLVDLLSEKLNDRCQKDKNEDEQLIFFYIPLINSKKTAIKFGGYAFGEIASAALYLALKNPLQSVLYENVILKKDYASKDHPNRKNAIDKQLKSVNKLISTHCSLENFLEKIKIGVGCFVYRINLKYASKIELRARKNL